MAKAYFISEKTGNMHQYLTSLLKMWTFLAHLYFPCVRLVFLLTKHAARVAESNRTRTSPATPAPTEIAMMTGWDNTLLSSSSLSLTVTSTTSTPKAADTWLNKAAISWAWAALIPSPLSWITILQVEKAHTPYYNRTLWHQHARPMQVNGTPRCSMYSYSAQANL